ncbi:hypothetical protein BDZ97DRAFT_860119 [Flammula alnicola]|nr:hypothetical protein BDZ97DRAFT_860119 [Flammula alnicola]
MTSYRSRCASYAMEMLSHCLGVHHAIHLLLVDDKLWVWYYDRQGIIQSDGISIVADLSRFLVILFAFQRFTLEDFGVIRSLNPGAVAAHEHPASHSKTKQAAKPIKKANLPLRLDNYYDAGRRLKEVTLKLDEVLSPSPHCLAGRGTAVLAADGKQGNRKGLPMVCKIYYPEVKRSHEGTTLRIIHEIAKINGKEMTKHLPELYFMEICHNPLQGFKKLEKITNVKGGDFVKAWLEVVTCHSFLWKNYVEHGDPSLNNAMYDPSLKCGVLTDFDLSLLQWEPRVLGDDRTGTIPFMALDLLSQAYWEGTLKRYYHHELESFIWILLYTFLLYEDAERQRIRMPTTGELPDTTYVDTQAGYRIYR